MREDIGVIKQISVAALKLFCRILNVVRSLGENQGSHAQVSLPCRKELGFNVILVQECR